LPIIVVDVPPENQLIKGGGGMKGYSLLLFLQIQSNYLLSHTMTFSLNY